MSNEVRQAGLTEMEQIVARQKEMLELSQDILKAMEMTSESFKSSMVQWSVDTEALLPNVRQLRMALGTEWQLILKGFADVRQFFLSEQHDKEVIRLREFVELCERLKALKESGFLDRVADTMLQMEERANARR